MYAHIVNSFLKKCCPPLVHKMRSALFFVLPNGGRYAHVLRMNRKRPRKKPVNLSLGDGVLLLADALMKHRSYGSLTSLIEDLIRERYDHIFGEAQPPPRASAPSSSSEAGSSGRTASLDAQVLEAVKRGARRPK